MSFYGKDKDEACCDFCARDSADYRGDGRTLFGAPNELGPVICSWCIVSLGQEVAKLLDTPHNRFLRGEWHA